MQTWIPPTEDLPSLDPDDRPAPVEEPPPAPYAWFDPAPVTGWRLWSVIAVCALTTGITIALRFNAGPPVVGWGLAVVWLILTALAVLGMTVWESEDRVLTKVAIGGLILLEPLASCGVSSANPTAAVTPYPFFYLTPP